MGVAVANALSGNQSVAVVLLDKMQEKDPNPSIEQLKKTLFAGVRPKMASDSLFAYAQKSPSAKNFDAAVRANPFDARIVSTASDWYRQKKQIGKAYQMILTALRFNEYAPELWAQYALLSLDQGLTQQGDDAEIKVKQYAAPQR